LASGVTLSLFFGGMQSIWATSPKGLGGLM
jgi:hypothetical protein